MTLEYDNYFHEKSLRVRGGSVGRMFRRSPQFPICLDTGRHYSSQRPKSGRCFFLFIPSLRSSDTVR